MNQILNTMAPPIFKYISLVVLLCMTTTVQAGTSSKDAKELSEKQMLRAEKQLNRVHHKVNRKITKLEARLKKAKKKAGITAEEDAGFLEGTDDRVRYGLIGVLGGILLSLILAASLQFIGIIALIAGLGLLIWYLIDP